MVWPDIGREHSISDEHRRIARSLSTGKVIDDCLAEDVRDSELHRPLPAGDDIRVELIMKDALAMYDIKHSDVCEIYSQPRVAQEASVKLYSGMKLQPGWSLDLTMSDPATGEPWDLSKPSVQRRVMRMVQENKPFMVIG